MPAPSHLFHRRRKCLASFAALLVSAGSALAEDQFWIGGGGMWDDPAHWNTGIPQAGDSAILTGAASYTVTRDATSAAYPDPGLASLYLNGESGAVVTLNHQGSSLHTASLTLGDTGAAQLIQNGGTFIADAILAAAQAGSAATLTLSGGTFIADGPAQFNSGARVQLGGSARLFFNGDATFSAGSSLSYGGVNLAIAPGQTLHIAGGAASFNTPSGNALSGGATLAITQAGSLTSAQLLDVANPFNFPGANTGTLIVDGAGSRIVVGGIFHSDWGLSAGGSATVTFSNAGAGTYSGGLQMGANGGRAVVSLLSGSTLYVQSFLSVGAGSGASNASITIDGGTLHSAGNATFANGASAQILSGGLVLDGNATFSSGATIQWNGGTFGLNGASTTVNGGQILLSESGDKLLRANTLAISGAGKIDLADNDAAIDYDGASPLATIRGYIIAGRNGGDWLGNGITSSSAAALPANRALGYADNTTLGLTTFNGQPVDDTSILIKFTFPGDADLDGDVDGIDVGAWAQNFTGELGGSGSAVWTQGDWDYDGDVDGIDVGLWAQNFTGELGGGGLSDVIVDLPGIDPLAASILAAMGITVVPEPGAALLVAGMALTLRRRRFPLN